jgi:hypothetical protein
MSEDILAYINPEGGCFATYRTESYLVMVFIHTPISISNLFVAVYGFSQKSSIFHKTGLDKGVLGIIFN